MPPLVSVVVLSYNRPQYLEQALKSIAAQTYPNLEIIVVDNPSPASEEIRTMATKHPGIRFVPMGKNAGYAGGMNEGICRALGEYIYLTEDDMATGPEAIAAMVDYMERDPQAGIVSGIHYNDRGALVHGGGFIRLGSTYSQFLIGRDTPEPPSLDGPFCATYATGAMMLLRRSVIERLGAFREDFFMYFEDVELCTRYIAAGKTVVIVPTAQAKTFDDSTARPSRTVEFHKLKNFLATNLLHAPARGLPEFFLRYAGLNLLRHLLRDRHAAMVLLRAEFWIAGRFRQLLRERREFAVRGRGTHERLQLPSERWESV